MTITIDKKLCDCEPGESILAIASRNGVTIPSLCNHEGLPGQGCCRVCIVEVEINGKRSIVTACVYPVEQECAVFTNSDNISRQRGMILSLLRSFAPDSDEIARLCDEYEAPEIARFAKSAEGKCILCGLCVKACESLGTGAIGTAGRGIGKNVTTPYDEPSAVCVGCASCAEVCPTGAIKVVEGDKERTIWNKTFPIKTCSNCGSKMGTYMEHWRASVKSGAEAPDLCDACRKKAIADVLAATYGS